MTSGSPKGETLMRSRILILLAMLALGAIVPASAAAARATAIRGSFDNGYESFVDTEVCAAAPWAFDVEATQHEYGFFTILLDQDGNFVRATLHSNYDAWISANGHTIVERDTWETQFTADGTRDAGLTVHIQGPGGIVVRDAGQIVRDADGNVISVRGPHEQFSGVSFCPALAG
jgi:hypothetical protein